MATTSVTLSGFVFDNAGNAVQDAAVVAYTSADNATSAISGLTDTTDANGRWDITTADESQYPMDIKITFGSAVRWIKAANGINLTRLTVSGAAVFGENDTGVDVTMYGATSGRYLLWDESEDALHLNDSTELKIGSLAAGDMILYHDGTNSYITNATGALKIATESSGIAVTIGHGTSEVTVADNLTVTGNLTVSGTQTVVDTVTMNAANAIVFEGATANTEETTLTIVDPDADRTIYLPNQSGYIPVLAAETSSAQISTTVAELNLIDGGTARGTDAIADGDGVLINDAGTMKMTTVQTLATYMEGEIDALTNQITANAGLVVDNITIDGTEIDLSSGDLTIDVAGDIVLDADGDDITFKAGSGDSTGLAFTNSSGSWVLKTGTSDADFTIAGNDGGSNVNALVFDMSDAGKATFAGNVVVTGDLTVSGDDLFMGTNTDAYMLIADGTNYNPVAISGDIAITNAGVTSIASNSIVNADVNSSAAIADSKLATISTADKVAGGAIQIDSGTDGTSITVADTDKLLIDDGGTTKYINASQLNTYTGETALDDIGTGDAAATLATTVGNITIDAQATDADVVIKVDDNGSAVTAVTFDGSDEGNAIFVNDIQLNSDGALLEFGADQDTVLTHTDGTGLTLNSTNKLTFGDAASFVQQSSDGTLRIDGEAIIDLNASTRVDVSGDLKVGTSVQTATIDYTDGDLAMTIADGGGVTFAQASTFTGGLTLNGDVNLAVEKLIKIGGTAEAHDFDDEHSGHGITLTMEAGENLTLGQAVYVDSNGKAQHPDVDAATVTGKPAIGIAMTGASSGASVNVMVLGMFRDATYDFTPGAAVIMTGTDGALTTTAGDTAADGDIVQRVGIAITADMLFVMPSIDEIEHA